jgi:hypothetical protein
VHVYSIQTFGFLTPGRMSHLASNQHDDLAGERWTLEHAQQMAGHESPGTFFDDQPESEPMSRLCQKIRDNDRLPRTGHSKQDAMLRSVSEPCPDSDKIASGPVVNCFGLFKVPG